MHAQARTVHYDQFHKISENSEFRIQLYAHIKISENECNTWNVLPRPMVWARIHPRPLSPDLTFLIDCIIFSHMNLIPVICRYKTVKNPGKESEILIETNEKNNKILVKEQE